jgi:hypothetical protein
MMNKYNFTYNMLSKKTEIPQNTLETLGRKGYGGTFSNLVKCADAMGIPVDLLVDRGEQYVYEENEGNRTLDDIPDYEVGDILKDLEEDDNNPELAKKATAKRVNNYPNFQEALIQGDEFQEKMMKAYANAYKNIHEIGLFKENEIIRFLVLCKILNKGFYVTEIIETYINTDLIKEKEKQFLLLANLLKTNGFVKEANYIFEKAL